MTLPAPHPGLVVCYAYLWRDERRRGRREGVKDRPCAIVLAAADEQGDTVVTVVPITHSPPAEAEDGVEIPEPTRKRLGLDDRPCWAVVGEVNRFVWPGPDLRPVSRRAPGRFDYGVLPPTLFKRIRDRLLRRAARQRLARVRRGE